jgi:hypothetical protein
MPLCMEVTVLQCQSWARPRLGYIRPSQKANVAIQARILLSTPNGLRFARQGSRLARRFALNIVRRRVAPARGKRSGACSARRDPLYLFTNYPRNQFFA